MLYSASPHCRDHSRHAGKIMMLFTFHLRKQHVWKEKTWRLTDCQKEELPSLRGCESRKIIQILWIHMKTFTLYVPDYIKPSTFILNMSTYLYRSYAGRGDMRGSDKVQIKSAAAASWNLLSPLKYGLCSSSTHRFKSSFEGPESFRVWCHSWLTQSHRRDRSAFRCFNRKLTGLNHFSVNNKNNKIISEFSPFNFEFWNFFLTSVESVFILTAELWGHGQGATDGALWYPPLGLWQWICLKDPRTWLAL